MVAARRDKGLILIGLFKLAKAALLTCVGVLLLLQLRGDGAHAMVVLARHLRVDPNNALIHGLLARLFGLDRRKLEALSLGTFVYAAVFAIEGTGLLLAKTWAEYVTTVVTISFIPIEVYEFIEHASAIKAAAIAVNVAVVIYLVRQLARRRHERGRVA
jgi:uncharacterized membrane protein (DUF2068 family)